MPVFATGSGLDTPTGVTVLPFSVQGVETMDLTATGLGIGTVSPSYPLDVETGSTTAIYGSTAGNAGWGGFFHNNDSGGNRYAQLAGGIYSGIFMNGNVGIGTISPAAPLDVNGGVRGSGSTVIVNAGCSPEGMLGYDMTHHYAVYCSNSGKWTGFATSEALMITGNVQSASFAVFPASGVYTNTLLASNPSSSAIVAPSAGTYDISVQADICTGGAGVVETAIYLNGGGPYATNIGGYTSCEGSASRGVFVLAAGTQIAGECLENTGRVVTCVMNVVKLP